MPDTARMPPRPESIINPVQFRSAEPAPMGIADFGVTAKGASATAYEYNATSLEGQAVVRSMSVTISGSSSKVTAFELNAVIVLQRDGVSYTYWIQNGLHLDASSHQYTIGGAYVWNFSSSAAKLTAGELKGNSSSVLVTDTYYFIPGCGPSFPGQCSTLTLPATLTGRIISSTAGGLPYVAYQYDIGQGWVTYDNVTFLHMAGASDPGFRVSGFTPTPLSVGAYYDAEWVWVGAGGDSASVDQGSDINMTLARWNGHNFQSVPTAWNFGSNTGESASNVTDLASAPGGAVPAAHLASGPGSLGVVYNLSTVGFLNLTVPTTGPATLLVDGASVPFDGGWANVTLETGDHSLYLRNYTNASRPFSISAGLTTFLNLSGAGQVTLTESGLPTGTSWGVRVSTTNYSSIGSTLMLNLPNGTYPVSFLRVPGFFAMAPGLTSLTLPGAIRYAVPFSLFTFSVAISESGLPPLTLWWVNASGSRVQGTGATLHVSVPNGSTPYTAGASYEFVASPSQGTLLVSGGVGSPVALAFSYRPTFIDGVVRPADAAVSVNGSYQPVLGGTFNESVIPGSYLLVVSKSGYASQSQVVTATPGNVTWANFTLIANATQPTSDNSTNTSAAGIPLETVLLVVVVVVAVAAAAAVVLLRRRPSR